MKNQGSLCQVLFQNYQDTQYARKSANLDQ